MILNLSAKCSDLCWVQIKDNNGNVVYEHDGYVPDFMPDEHCGDYISLEIDVETGTILNWKPNEVKRVVQ